MIMIRRSWLLALGAGIVTIFLLLNGIEITYEHVPEPKPYQYGSNDILYNPSVFQPGSPEPGRDYTRMLVLGRLSTENVSWVAEELPDLPHTIYTVDSPNSGLPANKGHEAMAYLTYIIDNYDNLSDINIFMHPHRTAWHNNVLLDIDAVVTLKLLSSAHVIRQGYFNTRCYLDPGCPDWLHVDRPRREWDLVTKQEEPYLTSETFHALHGADTPIPNAISQPCCAQFAVSRERILARPRAEYVRYRDWILNTSLDDSQSGRLLEYSWQYIFSGNFEYCPSQHRCHCDGYGICFLGEEALRDWFEMLKKKEKVDVLLLKEWESGVRSGTRYNELFKESKAFGKRLSGLREEAIKRGMDPRVRAEECGREWKVGDGF